MRHLILAVLAILSLAPSTSAAELSPTWLELSQDAPPEVFKIEQYIEVGGGANLVVLDAGRSAGLVVGTHLKTYRLSSKGRPIWVETGHLQVIEVQDGATIAAVDGNSSVLAKALFPKFPGVMTGDFAVTQRVQLTRRQVLMPTMTLSYMDLFEDPKSAPSSFELKTTGLAQLKEAAQTFAAARVSLLMVEAYTDHNGPSNISQIESYQRAQAVRQMLISEFGFDEKRVVAVGYGDSEPADPTMAPGQAEANRRIVLKAVPPLQ